MSYKIYWISSRISRKIKAVLVIFLDLFQGQDPGTIGSPSVRHVLGGPMLIDAFQLRVLPNVLRPEHLVDPSHARRCSTREGARGGVHFVCQHPLVRIVKFIKEGPTFPSQLLGVVTPSVEKFLGRHLWVETAIRQREHSKNPRKKAGFGHMSPHFGSVFVINFG